MTKRIQAKHKVDRRLGVNLWGRPKSPFNTRAFGPGQHGQTRARGKPSDYKIQLQAKQKLKGYYGNLNERQFRNVFQEAERVRGNTGENLVGILESRLDAVVYRAKFALTVFQARQIINHGHIKVNGKKVNVGSYSLKENDEIEVRESSKQLATILSSIASKEREVPEYVVVDHKQLTAKYTRVPKMEEIPYPAIMEPNLVVEYYSR
ncbi:30S ribosomal protein S4 [Pelagibacteraceae bacterium]|nr:30S ribosomal protein S4 [Pelagibacteraceae bacterium]